MNILYYDEKMSPNDLLPLWETMKPMFPDGELLFLPNSVQLLTNASADTLFDIQEKIVIALDRIRAERPSEYQRAHTDRMWHYRDKQWKEAINKANKKEKKKKSICDGCTVNDCPDWSDSREEKCVWRSTNPGGI